MFHKHFPMLHLPTYSIGTCPPELSLALVAVGARYRFEVSTTSNEWIELLGPHLEPKCAHWHTKRRSTCELGMFPEKSDKLSKFSLDTARKVRRSRSASQYVDQIVGSLLVRVMTAFGKCTSICDSNIQAGPRGLWSCREVVCQSYVW